MKLINESVSMQSKTNTKKLKKRKIFNTYDNKENLATAQTEK